MLKHNHFPRGAVVLLVLCSRLWAEAVLRIDGRLYRNVIATAFDRPFQTSADLRHYLSNTKGIIRTSSGPVLFSYPGIVGLRLDGREQEATSVGANCVRAVLREGTYEVEILAVPGCFSSGPPVGVTEPAANVRRAGEFRAKAKDLKPGDTLIVRNGLHVDWGEITISGNGTEQAPILIRPQTPGGAVFTGHTDIALLGTHIVFRGFLFEHAGLRSVLRATEAKYIRVTQCQFISCGNANWAFLHILRIGPDCHESRVDHCYFSLNKGISLGLRVLRGHDSPLDNRFDHNIWRDIYQYWSNGQENIQLGGGTPAGGGEYALRGTVEYCLFDNTWGDNEIISDKSAANVIRYNTAAHCARAAFCLRAMSRTRFEGNVVADGTAGMFVYGAQHQIRNNLFLDLYECAISLYPGARKRGIRSVAKEILITENTFVNCARGIDAVGTNSTDIHPVKDIEIRGSRFCGAWQSAIDVARGESMEVGNNSMVPSAGKAAAMPREDMPEVPPAPLLMPSLYKRRLAFSMAPEDGETGLTLTDDSRAAPQVLPDGFVLEWEFAPASWTATGTLSFCQQEDGRAYTLSWGGLTDDGFEHGTVDLRKTGHPGILVQGPDSVYSKKLWRGKRAKKVDPEKTPLKLRAFTLIKRGGQIILLNDRPGWFRRTLAVPILLWEDRGLRAGAPLKGGRLRIVQGGSGTWRNIRVWEYGFTGPQAPPAPRAFSASTAAGGVKLTWEHGAVGRTNLSYELYRAEDPGFAPYAKTRLINTIRTTAASDFEIVPGTTYTYKLRARNAAGLVSEPVAATVAAAAPGPGHQYLRATAPQSTTGPVEIRDDAVTASSYLEFSHTSGVALDGVPLDVEAVYSFTISTEDEYSIWALCVGYEYGPDSYYVALDGSEPTSFSTRWIRGKHDAWSWACMLRKDLSAGEHTLYLRPREGGIKFRGFLITNDGEFSPIAP